MTEPGRGTALGAGDRFKAWLVTGPLGRVAALAIEFVAALGRALRRHR